MNKTALYAMAMLLVPWLSCTNHPVQNLANPPMGKGETGEHAKMILPPVKDTVLASGRKNIYLAGLRTKPGFFTERYIFPPGYKGMPHVHNSDLYITILSGSAHIVQDKVFDTTAASVAYGPGSFVVIKADQPHYEWFTQECTMQVSGIGPNETYYLPEEQTKK
jgi:quercetin dioxygenase-like cupin family protein